MTENKVYTIGFTNTSAENFFNRLIKNNVKKLIDVRLNNTSQLAGFAKEKDLRYFLKTIANIEYIHEPSLAPNKDILDEYKKNKGEWSVYERQYNDLLDKRRVADKLKSETFVDACLLCSEDTADFCHRRLAIEYLNKKWGMPLIIRHL